MLRVVRPTSPMNIGAWRSRLRPVGRGGGAARRRRARRGAGRRPRPPPPPSPAALTTYTGVLLADTAVPAWHDARRELPFLFAAGAATSAGAAAAIFTAPPRPARPGAWPWPGSWPSRRRCGDLPSPSAALAALVGRTPPIPPGRAELADAYKKEGPGRPLRQGRHLAGPGRRSRPGRGRAHRAGAAAGGALVLASAAATRFAVFHAGSQWREPGGHDRPAQRARLAAGWPTGADRAAAPTDRPPPAVPVPLLDLRQDLFGVQPEEAVLVGPDLVDVDVVEAGVDVLLDRVDGARGRARTGPLRHVLA